MNNTDAITPRARDYFALWNDLIAGGLGRRLGATVCAEFSAGGSVATGPGETSESGLWIRLFGGKAGEQAFSLTEPDAAGLARLLSGVNDEAGRLSAEGRETVLEFFQQLATVIPTADWLGMNCELETSDVPRIDWEASVQVHVQFSGPQGALFHLRVLLSADFASAIESSKRGTDAPGKDPLPTNPASAEKAQARAQRDVNLELLMDVELEATLRFGQREMLLGDVLNLAPGSVVELDQQVQDPVELLVGSKVIAWGEVVAVDGNYGLRIIGLASREERLESLRR
ncbi:MAG: FliM/FliN family flagellar motor switch protein [Terriglobia bacterium]